MSLIVSFQPKLRDSRIFAGSYPREAEFDSITDSPAILNMIEFISSFIFLLGLFVLIETLFFWVPSLTDITQSKGRMIWLRKGLIFPERVLSFLAADVRVIIRRKRSSFHGLFLREFLIEIYLSKDELNIKQIIDFSGIEKIIKTSTHYILAKTVNLEHLPLQIIQIRSILALMKPPPVKILSSQ